MLRLDGCDITLTRGDTLSLCIKFTKRRLYHARALWTLRRVGASVPAYAVPYEVTANQFVINLPGSETSRLAAGDYQWDLRLILPMNSGSETITPFAPARMTVLEAIGNA